MIDAETRNAIDNYIMAHYKEEYPDDIAKIFGVSGVTIRHICRELGVTPRRKPNAPPEVRKLRGAKFAQDGIFNVNEREDWLT